MADGPDVSDALMVTKLTPPIPAPWLLPRRELVAQTATAHEKLCLISAPAGWGKTSLLAAWHEADATQPFAFLSLESGDDDVATLWTYIIAALRNIHPELVAEVDAVLRTPGVDPMRQIVPSLVNELCEIDEPMVLVLDDYHVLTQDAVHASILYLIDHLPPKMRLVIATRSDPPFPLGRFRALGQMTEVRANHLRLAEEEATQLLIERFGVDMDPGSVKLLCQRTEGWPAALHLAGLSLQGEVDRAGFVRHFAGDDRNVADYLTGEILHRLPGELRMFLLQTSILDRLTGPLCDTVADATGSAQTLDELERGNLFLVPLDTRRSWYRYHHLFGDWLRHELRRTEPDLVAQLHSRASRWHEEHGFLEPAISHAIAAGEHKQAGGLIDRYLAEWVQVNWSAVRRWLDRLPEEVVETHPMAVTAKVMFAWVGGNFAGGLRWISTAESAVATAPDELRPVIEATVDLFRALGELGIGDMEVARVALGEIADRERPSGSPVYAIAVGHAGIATFWSVGALDAIPILQEGVTAHERMSLPDSGITALLAAAYAEIGDWAAAETTAEAALELPPPFEQYQYPHHMPAHYAMGQVLIARGHRHEGIASVERGLDLARGWVDPVFIAYGCLILADALTGYREKRTLVREARRLIEDGRGRGRIGDLVAAAERKLSLREPSQRTAGTVHVEPLTARERDVLRLLESELSLREIAGELYLSHNTVKGYTKSIYRKLGVSSRAAAIDTAKELDLT